MERGKDKVTGLRGFQRDLNGLLVAHFAYQDDLWRLAPGRSQCKSETGSIAVQFPLVNDRFLMPMHELDRVLDGKDVIGV